MPYGTAVEALERIAAISISDCLLILSLDQGARDPVAKVASAALGVVGQVGIEWLDYVGEQVSEGMGLLSSTLRLSPFGKPAPRSVQAARAKIPAS
jgi:hypothetical protein